MNTTGYYGKLPLRGDFVSGRLPSTFKNLWDDWSQQLVTACERLKQENSGDTDLWYRLPVYRFYLSSAIAGDNAWLGIMLPSCDSVGRLFPFCLVRDMQADISASTAFTRFDSYLCSLEQLLEDLYSGEFQFESLEGILAGLDSSNIEIDIDRVNLTRQSSGDAVCIKVGNEFTPGQSEFWSSATNAMLNSSFAGHSVWSTSPLSNTATETLICEAMPSPESCESFFTGDFNQQHWTTVDGPAPGEKARGANKFSSKTIVVEENSDTKPLDKLPIDKMPLEQNQRAADFLELGDSDSTDAPWDD